MLDIEAIRHFIKAQPEKVVELLDSERSLLLNSPELKILYYNYLWPYWEARVNKAITFAISINECFIERLNFDSIDSKLRNSITAELKIYKILRVDFLFDIVEMPLVRLNHDFLIDESNLGRIVFFFGENGVDLIIRGKIVEKINFFYDETDRQRYKEKYHIADLQKCMKDYEVYIHEPGVNQAFFASQAVVSKLIPDNPPNNILLNKPEGILRDNLISFLNRNTQHTFSKENELNNRRELDLYTEADGRKYLIEVKWLGQSINDDETNLTKRITDYAAREGVIQTLEYIQHLIKEMKYNVHCGFLCVFDVREEKCPIAYQEFNFIPTDLRLFFDQHFSKLDEIRLDRRR